jgi:hypothetical protein
VVDATVLDGAGGISDGWHGGVGTEFRGKDWVRGEAGFNCIEASYRCG